MNVGSMPHILSFSTQRAFTCSTFVFTDSMPTGDPRHGNDLTSFGCACPAALLDTCGQKDGDMLWRDANRQVTVSVMAYEVIQLWIQ